MHCKMFSKVRGLSEGFGANRTHVGTHATVDLPVLRHAACLSKRPSALWTQKRSLAQMRSLVTKERQRLVEGFATLLAKERLVVGVHVPHVFPQVGGAHKVFTAFLADVGLLSRVRPNVFSEVRGPDVGFFTEGTLVRSFTGVEPFVLLKCTLVRVGFSTHVTDVRPEATVSFHVTRKVAGLLESPVTVSALVRTVLRVSLSPSLFHRRKHKLTFQDLLWSIHLIITLLLSLCA